MPINSYDNYHLTWKPEKNQLKQPHYLSLASALEADVCAGILKPGTKLPPQRELADYLDINFTTVTRSYNLCKQKGLIYGVTGRGTFVAPHAAENISIHEFSLKSDIIEMGYISSFEQCNAIVAKAVQTVAQKQYLTDLLNYNYMLGHPHHLAAGLGWLEQYGIHCDMEHIAIVSGVMNGLSIILATLFSPGDAIAVDYYTYPNFIELAKIMHIRLIPVRSDREGMLATELDLICTLNSVRGIYLMPPCNNPTTISITANRRRELAKVLRKHHVIIIEDDVFAGLPSAEPPTFYTLLPEQTCYLSDIPKALCTGLRVSFLVFGEPFREKLQNGIYNMNMKTSSLDADIIAELIQSGDANKLIHKKHELALKTNRIYDEYFPEVGSCTSKSSFFRWLPFPCDKPGKQVEHELMTLGVEIFHSYRFTVIPNEDQHYLRITLSKTGNSTKLQSGLKIIRQYMQENLIEVY